MSGRCIRRVVSVASLGFVTVVSAGLMAVPGSAAGTTTLHFYSVKQTFTAATAAGQTIANPQANLTIGTRSNSTNLLYPGNHRHHAPTFSGSDHVACTITSAASQTCDVQIAIGGSLLLQNGVMLPSNSNTASAPISAGTGKYKNAQGTVTSTTIGGISGRGADNTITLTG